MSTSQLVILCFLYSYEALIENNSFEQFQVSSVERDELLHTVRNQELLVFFTDSKLSPGFLFKASPLQIQPFNWTTLILNTTYQALLTFQKVETQDGKHHSFSLFS